MPMHLKSKLAAALFGLGISFLLIFTFNYYCKMKIRHKGIRYTLEEEPLTESIKSRVVPHEVYEKYAEEAKKHTEPLSHDGSLLDYEHKFIQRIPDVYSYRSIVKYKNSGELLYDVKINFDGLGRRKVKIPPNKANDTSMVFLGCSYTFGEGIEDFETFSSRLSEIFQNTNVYNLGKSGGSINQTHFDLTHFEKDSMYQSIETKKIVLVYTFFQDHLIRLACNLRCMGQGDWMLKAPRYVLKNGTPVLTGVFKDYFFKNAFTDFIFKSSIFEYYNFQFPDSFAESNIDLTVSLLNEIRREYEKKFQVLDFYVYVYENTGTKITNSLAKKLISSNIKPIIYVKYPDLDYFKNALYFSNDGHPTPMAHNIMADSISWFVSKDHPEFVKTARENEPLFSTTRH